MIKRSLEKYGLVPLTIFISFFCTVVSVLISTTIWSLTGQPELTGFLFASIICPIVIAPPVTYKLLKLLAELEHKKDELLQLNLELKQMKNQLEQALSEVKDLTSFLPACEACKVARKETIERHLKS